MLKGDISEDQVDSETFKKEHCVNNGRRFAFNRGCDVESLIFYIYLFQIFIEKSMSF